MAIPLNVFLGKWEVKGDNISLEYRLVFRTIRIIPEELPGPIQHETMKVFNKALSFDRKTFHQTPGLNEITFRRTAGLDESAIEVVNGTSRTQPQ
jgi:hypothetical protein